MNTPTNQPPQWAIQAAQSVKDYQALLGKPSAEFLATVIMRHAPQPTAPTVVPEATRGDKHFERDVTESSARLFAMFDAEEAPPHAAGETPRTDVEAIDLSYKGNCELEACYVSVPFARTLERELNAAKEKRCDMGTVIVELRAQLAAATKKQVEALSQARASAAALTAVSWPLVQWDKSGDSPDQIAERLVAQLAARAEGSEPFLGGDEHGGETSSNPTPPIPSEPASGTVHRIAPDDPPHQLAAANEEPKGEVLTGYQAIDPTAIQVELRRLMNSNGVSQSELAKRMGVSRQYISRVLDASEGTNFTVGHLDNIAGALGMEIAVTFLPRSPDSPDAMIVARKEEEST